MSPGSGPLFFPASDGYFLVADHKTTEPVIVNERLKSDYITWLPQEGELQKCWNLEVGFARSTPPFWMKNVAVRVRAMVRTESLLFAAGPPDLCDATDPPAALEGRRGGVLLTIDPVNGQKLHECQLESPPVFDGLSAAGGGLYMPSLDGTVTRFSSSSK